MIYLSNLQFHVLTNQHLGIYLGRTELRATNVVVALRAVYNHGQRLSHLLGLYLRTDILLHAHQLIQSALLHVLGHVILVVVGRIGTVLLGIGKGAHTLKARPFHKVHQLLEVLVGLAWESHHQRGADMDAGHLTSHPLDKCHRLRLRGVAAHTCQHMVADMLQGDIQVAAHVFLLAHHVEQAPGEMCGIGVMQTNPLHALDISHLFYEFGNTLFAIQVYAVVGQFLCDDLKLLRTLTHQPAHLVQDLLHGAALVSARNQWDGAVRTVAVTALTNLDIGIV